jgi:hypothetical protein
MQVLNNALTVTGTFSIKETTDHAKAAEEMLIRNLKRMFHQFRANFSLTRRVFLNFVVLLAAIHVLSGVLFRQKGCFILTRV